MIRRSLRPSLTRVREAAWPVAQAAGAAGVSWFVAHTMLGRPEPVFAPIAAVVALGANVGGRGRQAFEMLVGVAVGVLVGEFLVLVLGTGAVQVAIVAAVAMLTAAALMYSPLPLIQAGASAVLIVTLHSPESGAGRMLDALIGGGVALFVSQVLFPPSPVSVLAGVVRRTLGSVADELREIARALDDGDAGAAEAALERLRERQGPLLADLAGAREKAGQISRRTLRGRRLALHLRRLDACLGEADLLFTGTLLLAQATKRLLEERDGPPPGWAAPALHELGGGVEALAEDLESSNAGRRARASALSAMRRVTVGEDSSVTEPLVTLVSEGVRLAASGLLRLAGTEGVGSEAATRDSPASPEEQ